MQLQDKVALVTGGGTGIGRAIATLFAREGATVVVAGRTPATGEETVARIRATDPHRGEAFFQPTDVSKSDDVKELFAVLRVRCGRLDVLVNNAGVGGPGKPVEAISEAEWDHVLGTNLKGAFLCTRAATPLLRAAGGGAIINLSSVLGEQTLPGCVPYTASKAAIIGFTKAVALELARENIRVNCILPGSVDTPMMWEGLTEAERSEVEPVVAAATPVGRVGAPEEIARVALFLASNASSFMTGAPLVVDGGLLTKIAAPR
jgi:NAD(P)-dependent dehydrogenase (short-subunit alcohol dehydrogenase family)